MRDDNPYSIPSTKPEPDTQMDAPRVEVAQEFFGVSRLKLVTMYFATMGLYSLVWFHQNWRLLRNRGANANPWLRSLFTFVFANGLFRTIADRAQEKNISLDWNPGILTAVSLTPVLGLGICLALALYLDEAGLLLLVALLYPISLHPLFVVQKTVNEINGDPAGRVNDQLTADNWVFIPTGFAFQFLFFAGLLILAL